VLELPGNTNSNTNAVQELVHTMQLAIVFFTAILAGLLIWIGMLSEKIKKFKARLRQLEDWRLQSEARLSPKP